MKTLTINIKRAFCILISFILFSSVLFLIPSTNAFAENSVDLAKESKKNIPIIEQYMSAINTQDWQLFKQCYSPDIQKLYVDFPTPQLEKTQQGILSLNHIELYEIKQIPVDYALIIEPRFREIDLNPYSNIRAFYVGFNYDVKEENEFFYNGVSYKFILIGLLNGKETIVGEEDAYYMDKLISDGYAFNSDAEAKAQKIIAQRKKGYIVNFDGKILEKNSEREEVNIVPEQGNGGISKEFDKDINVFSNEPSIIFNQDEKQIKKYLESVKITEETGISIMSDSSAPSTIKVLIKSTGAIKPVKFTSYVKDVLPNEWYSTWPKESLKAGAMACKMYGWYNVDHPRTVAKNGGYHVNDSPSEYQRYVEGSNVTSTNEAVNAILNVGMRSTDEHVFESYHVAGTAGTAGNPATGTMSQWGTKYLAETYPEYSYRIICSYYYSYSISSYGLIHFFTY